MLIRHCSHSLVIGLLVLCSLQPLRALGQAQVSFDSLIPDVGEDLREDLEVEEITHFAPLPDPALEYRFWPAEHELQPGDATPLYLRALVWRMQPNLYDRISQGYAEVTEDPLAEPLTSEQAAAIQHLLQQGQVDKLMAELRRATFREPARSYHRLEQLQGIEFFKYLLPEVHEMRMVARLLDLQIRLDIAEGNYEEAAARIRDGVRLGASLGDDQLIIAQLVGAAIIGIMLDDARQLASATEAPNLYWALASLPRPIVSIDKSIAFETSFAKRFLAEPLPPSGAAHAEAWRVYAVEKAGDIVRAVRGESPSLKLEAAVALGLITAYPDAQQNLLDAGYTTMQIEAMSAIEVVVRALRREFQATGQKIEAWSMLPMIVTEPQRDAYAVMEQGYRQASRAPAASLKSLLWSLMPAVGAATQAGVRLQVQVDSRMTIEAIRAHIAETGALPTDLESLDPVPAIPDPRTGDHFAWHLTDEADQKVGVLEVDMRDLNYKLFRYRFKVDDPR